MSGQDIRDQNGMYAALVDFPQVDTMYLVIAAQSIANIVKSSLGPLGLDKMLVDNIGVGPKRLSSALVTHPAL